MSYHLSNLIFVEVSEVYSQSNKKHVIVLAAEKTNNHQKLRAIRVTRRSRIFVISGLKWNFLRL